MTRFQICLRVACKYDIYRCASNCKLGMSDTKGAPQLQYFVRAEILTHDESINLPHDHGLALTLTSLLTVVGHPSQACANRTEEGASELLGRSKASSI